MARSLNFYAPAKKKQHQESRLQKAVVQVVRLTHLPGVLWFSVPNEGKRSVALGDELKRMGLRPGVADLCFIVKGRAHFLELKSADGKQSKEQVAFEADCAIAGAHYAVAKDLDEAMAVLRRWSAIRGKDSVMRRAA